MRTVKFFIILMMSLAFFCSRSSAEIMMMSLQEAMRQSDAVVMGTIQEIRQTDTADEEFPLSPQLPNLSVEKHFLATCRVERYIKGPKIHDPSVEEAKAVKLIRIAFKQKKELPAPIQLAEGRRYLLFLKETESQKAGERLYEMFTPYHGAVEPGQTHNLYDEQNPSGALSFDEIVSRLTNVLLLTVKSDKDVYEVGEEVRLTLEFKNVSAQNVWLFAKIFPNADLKLRVYKIDGDKREDISPPIALGFARQIAGDADFKELLPREVFSEQITLKDFSERLILAKGTYEISVEFELTSYLFGDVKITPWTGKVFSNTVTIGVVETYAQRKPVIMLKEVVPWLRRQGIGPRRPATEG
jgi:hypothetical protein